MAESLKLPYANDATDYMRCFNDAVWQQAAAIICARHRVAYTSLLRSPQGENIIFFVDGRYVIKIFAPFRQGHLREAAAFEFAATAKLSIGTPQVVHAGEIEGWPYLVTTRINGHASREVWESMSRRDRIGIVSQLGVAMRELHAPGAPISQAALDRDWPGFIERQARTAVKRQRACNANPEWLESLPAYINARLGLLPTDDKPVLLHGDIHAGNVLLAETSGRWHVTGLIDFGDSLCGFSEYEFVAPGVLMVQGDRELQRAMLVAYGYEEAQLGPDLRARLMLLTVLYECSDLHKYALRLAPGAVHLTLDQLEAAIWKFAAD